jgi:hypothetical protein
MKLATVGMLSIGLMSFSPLALAGGRDYAPEVHKLAARPSAADDSKEDPKGRRAPAERPAPPVRRVEPKEPKPSPKRPAEEEPARRVPAERVAPRHPAEEVRPAPKHPVEEPRTKTPAEHVAPRNPRFPQEEPRTTERTTRVAPKTGTERLAPRVAPDRTTSKVGETERRYTAERTNTKVANKTVTNTKVVNKTVVNEKVVNRTYVNDRYVHRTYDRPAYVREGYYGGYHHHSSLDISIGFSSFGGGDAFAFGLGYHRGPFYPAYPVYAPVYSSAVVVGGGYWGGGVFVGAPAIAVVEPVAYVPPPVVVVDPYACYPRWYRPAPLIVVQPAPVVVARTTVAVGPTAVVEDPAPAVAVAEPVAAPEPPPVLAIDAFATYPRWYRPASVSIGVEVDDNAGRREVADPAPAANVQGEVKFQYQKD